MRLKFSRRRQSGPVALAEDSLPSSPANELRAPALRSVETPLPRSKEKVRRQRLRDGFVLTETVIHIPNLEPAHQGLRIAQLSDVHIGQATPDARILRALEAVNAQAPDLVFLTGDYVTHSPKPLPRVPRLLAGLKGQVFVVLGNHDHWVDPVYLRTNFEALGYTVLQNEHRVLNFRGSPLTVLGIDDGLSRMDDVTATFKGAPESGTRLVLAHTPPTVEKLPPHANLVQFSGHTHGGQFVVRGLTEALFKRAGQPYISGHYAVRGNQLYVNRGLGFGFGGPYLRRGSQPEVGFFTLQAAPTSAAL